MRRSALLLMMILSSSPVLALQGVQRWAVQLQQVDLVQIVTATDFDMVVLDYAAGSRGEWSPSEIASIRDSGKMPVAYISIGEAETYRWYWDPAWNDAPPDWLGPLNPNWHDNYKVRYWDPDWQAIVFEYVDRIIGQGFDGLFMDVVDAYYYWSVTNPERPQAALEMIDFVDALRDHAAAAGRADLVLIAQNSDGLLGHAGVTDPMLDVFCDAVDALSVESVFFRGPADEDNPWNPDTYRLELLDDFQARGLSVFSIEYLVDPVVRDAFFQIADYHGFVPFATRRELDFLPPQPTIDAPADGRQSWHCGPAHPNPTTGTAFLPIATPAGGGPVVLEIYDTRGRLLQRREENLEGGDAMISLMRPVAPGPETATGTYLYLLRRGSTTIGRGKISFVK